MRRPILVYLLSSTWSRIVNLRREEYEVYIDVEVKLENVDSILGLEIIINFCSKSCKKVALKRFFEKWPKIQN